MTDRAKRRHESFKKYKKRLKKWMTMFEGNQINRPESWTDLKEKEWSKFLKNTPTPCSCAACVGESYDRNKKRKEDNRTINEQLEYLDDIMEDYSLMKITDFKRYNNKV